ncbi:glycosyltransferase [Jiangella mangrovi]|uniref:Glycosyltransferase involved in cell wall biosynthesis n=1 Tax=Jiangella mangrovi TaxID=1524084 RepID=A0A7W9GRG4_9ACTN|nr:glycosyltransferase involved in cell wall biosynthesis [Jiangella mangrovi]
MERARADVVIISSGHDVADARLHKITGALRRQGLRVEVCGLGDAAAGPTGARVSTRARGGLAGRAWRALTLPWRADGAVVFTLDPDLVPMATVATRLRRRRLVVDVHEDYQRLLSDRSWARGVTGALAGGLVRLSNRLAARADLSVVADEHIPPRSARRRVVVENMPDPALLPAPAERDVTPRAIYIGDLRASRGLFDMLDAVAAAPGWHLDLIGPVSAADQDTLHRRLGADPGLAERVTLPGRLPPEESWRRAAGAWTGLVFLRETPAFREAMPTKLYEYLATGLPVLTTRLPRQVEMVERTGAGLVIDGVDDAAAVLRRWADDPGELDVYRDKAIAWSEEHFKDSPYDRLAVAVADLVR